MPAPLLWLLGGAVVLGGVAAVAASSASSSTDPRLPPAPETELDALLRKSDAFTASIAKYAGDPSRPDFATLATAANAAKAKAEADTRSYINTTVDKYRDAIVTGLTYTGIGLVLVPFVYLGAVAAKWAGNAQLTLMKLFFGGGGANGWTDDDLANLNYEIEWLSSRGIPFPGWHEGKGWNSPMGYVNGGGGASCGSGGLCSIREAFERMPDANMRARALAAMALIRKRLPENPTSVAFYAYAYELQYAWSEVPDDRVMELLPVALATSIAQDYGVQFALWQPIVDVARKVFRQGFAASEAEGWRWPAVVGLTYAYSYAIAEATKRGGRPGVDVLRMKF